MTRIGKAARDRQKKERAAIEAEALAEQKRVHALGQLFEALPDGPAKAALQEAMTDRVIELYNNVRWEQGDAILEFLPPSYAQQLLDWYLDEDGPPSFPPQAPTSEHEASQQRQVQGEPQIPPRADGGLPAIADEIHTSEVIASLQKRAMKIRDDD